MADDNVVAFTGKSNVITFHNNAGPILIVQPDGTKLRGFDRKPLHELNTVELEGIIDQLCSMITRRG